MSYKKSCMHIEKRESKSDCKPCRIYSRPVIHRPIFANSQFDHHLGCCQCILTLKGYQVFISIVNTHYHLQRFSTLLENLVDWSTIVSTTNLLFLHQILRVGKLREKNVSGFQKSLLLVVDSSFNTCFVCKFFSFMDCLTEATANIM